ncbi:ABC transporter substrate-binding protein [Paraburkholderia sp. CNPSo 3076]|uniref:ABC transporter substrate-binding protein n=1 Tax=Paraburkholderia sp. CNPSo 3076 TaxID=2940936 RepID=UPI00224D3DAB|nr:ABC transporter substrate-binding protein [Paraburkholderia sp. CNPSo 3076]MCX5540019.1 ABC transporter substrate-binding protein [Paraburkholderia sp. CNPSo 3076]
MNPRTVLRRLLGLAAVAAACWSASAFALDKVVFLTSWYAQAEHGGFYQAVATGIYQKYGLDVQIRMGGPQVNGMQILTSGQADFLMGYDFQVLKSIEQGVPVTTVGAAMQTDPQGMMTHDDVKSLADLKTHVILVSTSGRTTWWPWLRGKYKLDDSQSRVYTFNLQPFFADPNAAQQAYASSEQFSADKAGVKTRFFLFADDGYPPYGTTIVTMSNTVKDKPDLVARFVRASMEGWKSYLADPAPANALIKRDNPAMKDDQLAYAVQKLKQFRMITGGDAATMGIGVMTDTRWKKTRDFMVSAGMLGAGVDWKRAYTTQFTKDLKVMP